MVNFIYKQLHHNYHHPNYFAFMVALILLLIVPPFSEIFSLGWVFLDVIFALVILLGAIYTTMSKRELIFSLFLGTIACGLFIFNDGTSNTIGFISAITNLLFFTYLFIKILQFLFKEKNVDVNTIFACISGYLILGILGALVYSLASVFVENAFNLPKDTNFYNYIYFSFVTLTTVGFGDITPQNSIAKSLAIIGAIIGQLYTTFLVAIIIGKYFLQEQKSD